VFSCDVADGNSKHLDSHQIPLESNITSWPWASTTHAEIVIALVDARLDDQV